MEKHVNTGMSRPVTCKNKCVTWEKIRVQHKRKFEKIQETKIFYFIIIITVIIIIIINDDILIFLIILF